MGSFIILGIGTVLTVLFLTLLFKGAAYDDLIEPLDSDAFPMKILYSAGFALQDTKLLRLRGKLGARLRDSASLYYGKKFGEFYARAVWAQALSFVLASLAAYYFLTYSDGELKKRRAACEGELPNAISKLALLVNSGATLHEAWKMVAFGKEGVIYELMRRSCEAMENGRAEIDSLYDFGVWSNSPDVKKFTSALIQSIERGGGELPIFLANQSGELWSQHRQRLLQKGEQAASALLMPIALMFVGVMLIVIASALQSFSL